MRDLRDFSEIFSEIFQIENIMLDFRILHKLPGSIVSIGLHVLHITKPLNGLSKVLILGSIKVFLKFFDEKDLTGILRFFSI